MPQEPATSRRGSSLNPLVNHFDRFRSEGTVVEVGRVTPTMRRIRVFCETLGGLDYMPGRHVRIEINDPLSLYGVVRPGNTLRTYTICEWSPQDLQFEIWAHLYEDESRASAIGLNWAHTVVPGDLVRFWGPLGDFTTREAPYHLFVGEESGACAFVPLIRDLGPDAQVYGVVESATGADEVPLPRAERVHRVHRNGASAASSSILPAAVAGLELPQQAGAAYIAGEARTGQAVRAHLIEDRGWPKEAIVVKAFWAPGKSGLHH